jgi:hypothetical protein
MRNMLLRCAALAVLLGIAAAAAGDGAGGGDKAGGGAGGGDKSGGGGGDKSGQMQTKPGLAKPPKEERPTECKAGLCANKGVCYIHPTFQTPACNCTNTGFVGMKCDKSSAAEQAANEERGGRQGEAAQAGKAMDQLKDDKEKCTDATKKMLCPPIAPDSTKGTCVGAISDCFPTDADRQKYKKDKEEKCPAAEKYCDQEGICLGKGASCAPADKCPASKPFRYMHVCVCVRLWGQMLAPPHIMHLFLRRLCSHSCDPPHSLHPLLIFFLWGNFFPPLIAYLSLAPHAVMLAIVCARVCVCVCVCVCNIYVYIHTYIYMHMSTIACESRVLRAHAIVDI